jgi:hypothetical protein
MIGVLSIGSPTDDLSRFDEFLLLIAVFRPRRERREDVVERLSGVVAERNGIEVCWIGAFRWEDSSVLRT